MLHNTVVGHYGLERTLKRFKDLNNTWEYQRQHVRYFIDHNTVVGHYGLERTLKRFKDL